MIDANRIKEHLEVVGSDGRHVGTVDHVDGNTIRLTRNDREANGQHHWMPLDLVASVDEKVHLNVSAPEAEQQWLQTGPLKEISG